MTEPDDKPARYSDEANLEPVARAAEVTPEIETEVPEASEHVETEPEKSEVAGTFLGVDESSGLAAVMIGTFSNTVENAAPLPTLEQLRKDMKALRERVGPPISPFVLTVATNVLADALRMYPRREESPEEFRDRLLEEARRREVLKRRR